MTTAGSLVSGFRAWEGGGAGVRRVSWRPHTRWCPCPRSRPRLAAGRGLCGLRLVAWKLPGAGPEPGAEQGKRCLLSLCCDHLFI